MTQILLILVEHPLTFGFLILCFMGLVGMTYEFILRLFGRKGIMDNDGKPFANGKKKGEDPLEHANVRNPDGPDDTLEAEEDIPVEDGE